MELENGLKIIYRNGKGEKINSSEEMLLAAENDDLNVHGVVPSNVPLSKFIDIVMNTFPIEEGFTMSYPKFRDLTDSTLIDVTIKKQLDLEQDKSNMLS